MNGFRYKLYQFMQGRRGLDNFSKFLVYGAVVLSIASMFMGKVPSLYRITYFIAIAMFAYGYFRMMSRNIYKREMENNKFLAFKYKITKGKNLQQRRYERATYTFFKCPICKQKMRAPRGRGKIKVTCNNCANEFIRKV